jgi:hypothetical protein
MCKCADVQTCPAEGEAGDLKQQLLITGGDLIFPKGF